MAAPEVPHYHVCQYCAIPWKHDPNALGDSREEHIGAHKCPRCGSGPYYDAFRTSIKALCKASCYRNH